MLEIEKYIAPDGGGMLHLNDRATINGKETTANENPILFAAYNARAHFQKMGGVGPWQDFWKPWIGIHAASVCLGPGRFVRREGDTLRQSHDNVLAWAWWSVMLGSHWAEEIYGFAKWRLFVYDPHRVFSFDLRCLLQPSHVFTLKLAAGRKPGWISTLWIAGSMVVADHSSDYYLKSMLRTDIIRERKNLISKRKWRVVSWAVDLMEKRREGMSRWYREYYRDDDHHPSVLAQIEWEV